MRSTSCDSELGEALGFGTVESRPKMRGVGAMFLGHDLAGAVHRSKDVATLIGDHELDDLRQRAQPLAHRDEKLVDATARERRDGHGAVVPVDESLDLR